MWEKTRWDVRYALRGFRRTPGFTAMAALSLALGTGASAAIFSLLKGIVLDPLPYPESDRLVVVTHAAPGASIDEMGTSLGTFVHYRELTGSLEDFSIYARSSANLTGDGDPERVEAAVVTGGFFKLLVSGPPTVGRLIREDDTRPDAEPVVVLSAGLWERRFGGDGAVVGSTIGVDGESVRVVGVAPRGFAFPDRNVQLWRPLRFDPAKTRLGGFSFYGLGRMKGGGSVEDVRAELQRLVPKLGERFPGPSFQVIVEQSHLTVVVRSLKRLVVGDIGRTLWILLGTAGIVLLIGVANVANLVLVRAEGRRREVALKRALGAGRARIVRGSLTEGGLLGLLGGAIGALLAVGGVRLVVALGPSRLPRLHEVGVDAPLVGFAVLLSVAAGLGLGLLPVLRARGEGLGTDMSDGLRTMGGGPGAQRVRDGLAAVQVSLALVLLIGSGLMLRTFQHVARVDPGFDPESALTFRIALPASIYPDPADAARFHHQVLERLAALPGVRAVGAGEALPLSGYDSVNPLTWWGSELPDGETPPAVQIRGASVGYFRALGVPVLAGRAFVTADRDEAARVAVISKSLAARIFPRGDALGGRIYPSVATQSADVPWYTVVGVVGDVLPDRLTDRPKETVYFPIVAPSNTSIMWAVRTLDYVVRTEGPPLALAESVRRAVWDLDPNLPVSATGTLDDLVSRAAAPTLFALVLLTIAAVVALVLGVVGVYGVLSYMVTLRGTEIGLRMALGASGGAVRRWVFGRAAFVALPGVGVGLVAAFGLTRLMKSLLFGVAPADWITFGGASMLLVVVALLAGAVPARRAAREDPAQVLRAG